MKKNGNTMSSFGSHYGSTPRHPVAMYVVLTVILGLICTALVVFLVVRKPEAIPVKEAYFPPEQESPGLLADGGLVPKAMDDVLAHPKAQTALGAVNIVSGQKTDAIKNFDKVIDARPDDPTGYLQRGAAYLVNGEIELGATDVAKAAELDPKYALLAAKCREINDLFKKSNFKASPEQIQSLMRTLTPKDRERITTQMMDSHQ